MSHCGLIVRCDTDGVVTDVLHEGVSLKGRAVLGRPLTALVAEDSFPKALAFLAVLRRDGRACNWEMEVAGPGGSPLYRFSGGRDGAGLTVAIIPADCKADLLIEELSSINSEQVTVLRQLFKERAGGGAKDLPYESLTQLNNELITAQRELAKANARLKATNDQKNFLLGMLAHDLRNPLNAISGFAELLEEMLAGRVADKEMSCLSTISESSRAMLLLVEDTLTLSALETGFLTLECQPVDLAELARRAVRLLAMVAEFKGVRLLLTLPPGPVQVSLDPTRIEQVLSNLITNAIKFSYAGSEVRVSVSGGEGQPALLEVRDQGTGIPHDVRAHLFEPFVRGHRTGTAGESSTGLGLAICHKIVAAHGGTIAVASEIGCGTTFTVTLAAVTVAP